MYRLPARREQQSLEPDPFTLNLIFDSASMGMWDTIPPLLEADPRLASLGDPVTGKSLLHMAAFQGNLNIVRWLIEEIGCSIAEQDPSGRSALYHATRVDAPPKSALVVEYLCEHHALIDADDVMRIVDMGTSFPRGETCGLKTLRCMLRYSTCEAVNYMDHRFYTPLACACVRGYAKIVHLLLLAGAEAYETYSFGGINAVEWDPGNRNALIKAQAVFRNDSAEKRAAKLRCVALIEVGD